MITLDKRNLCKLLYENNKILESSTIWKLVQKYARKDEEMKMSSANSHAVESKSRLCPATVLFTLQLLHWKIFH